MLIVISWIAWILILFSQLFYFSFMEGRKMFWSSILLNLVLTDRNYLKHLKSDMSLGKRYHKMIAYMITKQRGLEQYIFGKKGQAHHLECFIIRGIQKWKVILLLYLALLLCSILVFAFGKGDGDSGEGPVKISKSDVRNGDQLLREDSEGSGLFNLEKGRLRGDLTVFKYLKGYYTEDAEQMFFTFTGDQIKGNIFKL